MVTHLVDFVTHLISVLGYPGVFLWMTLESACIPIPSEAIMPFAGALIVTQHKFNIHALAFTGALANLFGSVIAYWVGAIGGRPFIDKYGKYILIHKRDVDAADHWFQKYGEATAFFSRVLPVIRTFISLPAGISRMNFGRFCLFTFLGAWPWCYLLTWVGIKFGEHMKTVSTFMHKADLGIGVILVALFGFWLWHHLRPDAEEKAEDAASDAPAVPAEK